MTGAYSATGTAVWSMSNPATTRDRQQFKRCKNVGAPGYRVDTDLLYYLWPHCGNCGEVVTLADFLEGLWNLDHVIPIRNGGSHTYANTQISHVFCNLSRSNRLDWTTG